MYSFYGGRPGAAFVIVKTFPSIADMIAAFQQGSNYIDVHYDEYVLINTQDRNDKDNGKLYRRGYEFSNAMGGAEYVGRLSGPAGASPALIPTSYVHISDNNSSHKPTAIVYDKDGSTELRPAGFMFTKKKQSGQDYTDEEIQNDINAYEDSLTKEQYALNTYGIEKYLMWKDSFGSNLDNEKTIITTGLLSEANGGLVRGDEWKTIQWKAASFTDTDGKETTGYFAMRVPFHILEFEAESVMNSQGASVEDITSEQTIKGEPATNYPFYKKWKINIPNIYPIDITNERWQGTGKIYDGPNTDNPYGTKRLAFTIPISDPLLDKITKIEVSGRMFVESFDVKENFTDAYFELESSVLKEVIFFKTMNAGDKLYLRNGISKDANDDIVFAEGAEVGEIASIRKTSLGVTVEVLTNLQSSNSQKTDFASIRFMNLYIRFYDTVKLPDKDDGSKTDVYGISNITNSAMYSNLLS